MDRISSPFPLCSLGCIIIMGMTIIGTITLHFLGSAVDYGSNAHYIFFRDQWYRLFTAPFAVFTPVQFLCFLLSLFWLALYLPVYEKKYSTIWVLYHFFKVTILIQISILVMYQISLHMFGLRGVNAMTSGILPYSFYIFLRVSEINPDQPRCQCTPFPLNKIVRNFAVYFVLQIWSSEPHELYIIFPYWVLTYFPCQCCKFLRCWNGPLFPMMIKCIERILPRMLLDYPRFHKYSRQNDESLMQRDVESEVDLN